MQSNTIQRNTSHVMSTFDMASLKFQLITMSTKNLSVFQLLDDFLEAVLQSRLLYRKQYLLIYQD